MHINSLQPIKWVLIQWQANSIEACCFTLLGKDIKSNGMKHHPITGNVKYLLLDTTRTPSKQHHSRKLGDQQLSIEIDLLEN